MSDLTLAGARSERDALAVRTDVLDKVGVLATLPDDMHVLTPMVAEFYGVGVEAIKSLVKDNRDELEEDGYRVVIRSEFERFYGDPANLIAPQLAKSLCSRVVRCFVSGCCCGIGPAKNEPAAGGLPTHESGDA